LPSWSCALRRSGNCLLGRTISRSALGSAFGDTAQPLLFIDEHDIGRADAIKGALGLNRRAMCIVPGLYEVNSWPHREPPGAADRLLVFCADRIMLMLLLGLLWAAT
jgi:hypothetical protein